MLAGWVAGVAGRWVGVAGRWVGVAGRWVGVTLSGGNVGAARFAELVARAAG